MMYYYPEVGGMKMAADLKRSHRRGQPLPDGRMTPRTDRAKRIHAFAMKRARRYETISPAKPVSVFEGPSGT